MTRGEVRATLVVVALVIVGVIALWPRSPETGVGVGPADTATPAAARVDPAELDEARRAAALEPCPTRPAAGPTRGPGDVPPVVGALEGRGFDCLGAPGPVEAEALLGRTTLVNFWASWCGPCREELPALRDYAVQPGAAAVLGVDVEDDPVAALRLLGTLDVRHPSVSDPDRDLVRRLGAVPVLPASVLVRPDGAVVPLPPEVFRTPDQVRAAVDRASVAREAQR